MPSDSAPPAHDHKAVVREEFTRQADAFAASAIISNEDRLARLVAAIDPAPAERALEVATGPGYVAMALAARCREVIGVDLTEAPLRIAERTRGERGIRNVSFKTADAENLPFTAGEFDIVVCRFAFHHFEYPARVLAEICRVCRPGGTIAIEDLFASEFEQRAAYWNRMERLRDHSHTRALGLSELIALLARAGIEITRVYSDEIITGIESWLATAQTGAEDAAQVRAMLQRDVREDLSGIRPFMRNGEIHFVHHTAALIGRKLGD